MSLKNKNINIKGQTKSLVITILLALLLLISLWRLVVKLNLFGFSDTPTEIDRSGEWEFGDVVFANPGCLYLLLLLIPLIGWYIYKLKNMQASFSLSSAIPFKGLKPTPRVYLRHLPFVLRLLALSALIIVVARPQSVNSSETSKTEGIDIVLAMDVSTSMLAEDFKPTRLAASKQVAAEFINDRSNDKIGLVVFAGESFTQCPLTTDHKTLLNLIGEINFSMIQDGTAIGLGLANSVNRLKDSDSKSRVVILLTDGSNNRGQIAPLTAADLAASYGIRVYTVGVGSKGRTTITDPNTGQRFETEADIDERVLTEIAAKTGGQYFRATDNTSLKQIYDEIDVMEKRHISVNKVIRRKELFFPYALFALCLIGIELILRRTVLRSIP